MAPRSTSANKKIREQRAKKIRAAALELFSSKGFHSTSISEVAQKAEMSKGLMYSYYDSKEDLLKAIVMSLVDESYSFAAALEKLATPREKIKATIEYSFEAMEKRPEEVRMLMMLTMHGDSMGEVSKFAEGGTRELIRFYVVILSEAGVKDPELETYLLVSALDGLGVHYLYFGKDREYPWKAIKKKFIEKTLNRLNL